MLRLVFHGGMCCGIKTIYGFGYDGPDSNQPALAETEKRDHDQYAHETDCDYQFFTDAAPKETTLQRLKRYIAFVEKRRPKHLIEIVLFRDPNYEPINDWEDQQQWFPIVEKLGFKQVSEFKNSNSGNYCHVFHLAIGQ